MENGQKRRYAAMMLLAAGLAAVVVSQWPEIQRYAKMTRM